MCHPNYWDSLVVSIFQKKAMEHTISGMFNLVFWQKERLTAFGFGVLFCLLLLLFWCFGFPPCPPKVLFFWCIFQSQHRSKSATEEKWKDFPLTFAYLGHIPNIHPLYGLYAECLWFRAVNLLLLLEWSAQCWHHNVPCRYTALELACAIQEQLWDLRPRSLWEGLLWPRKPNNIAVISMGFFLFVFFFPDFLTMRLKPLQRILFLLIVLLAVVLPRQTKVHLAVKILDEELSLKKKKRQPKTTQNNSTLQQNPKQGKKAPKPIGF